MSDVLNYSIWNFAYLLKTLAGMTAYTWHTILLDFILVAQKLEQLGFMYHHKKVVVVEHTIASALDSKLL
jgi:hypothetical protein